MVPRPEDLNLEGLKVSPSDVAGALEFDADGWRRELPGIREYFAKFGDRLPRELSEQLEALEARLA